jgi:hypothetical protein
VKGRKIVLHYAGQLAEIANKRETETAELTNTLKAVAKPMNDLAENTRLIAEVQKINRLISGR